MARVSKSVSMTILVLDGSGKFRSGHHRPSDSLPATAGHYIPLPQESTI